MNTKSSVSKAIIIKNLKKYYKNNNASHTTLALKGIDLEIEKGTIFGLLGPNGAGKSTLIGILSGLINKTSGYVEIWGNNADTNPRDTKVSIGVVPQELVIDPYLTPEETLNFQAGYFGLAKKDRKTRDILNIVGLKNKADAYTRSLSGGMKRRLMVAKAMAHRPPILILDEPTAGVDVELRKSLWSEIKMLNNAGVTILLTTHYLEEAEAMCDEIAIINNGKLISTGKTKEMVRALDRKELLITLESDIKSIPKDLSKIGFKLTNPNTVKISYKPSQTKTIELLDSLSSYGLRVKDLSTIDSSLEKLFLELTSQK